MEKVVADQRARQGGSGRPVLYVLVASLVLLAVYMVGLMGWSGATSPSSTQQQSSETQNRPGASGSNTNKTPVDNPAYPATASPPGGIPGSAPSR